MEIPEAQVYDLIMCARIARARAQASPFWYLAAGNPDMVALLVHFDRLETLWKAHCAANAPFQSSDGVSRG